MVSNAVHRAILEAEAAALGLAVVPRRRLAHLEAVELAAEAYRRARHDQQEVGRLAGALVSPEWWARWDALAAQGRDAEETLLATLAGRTAERHP